MAGAHICAFDIYNARILDVEEKGWPCKITERREAILCREPLGQSYDEAV